MCPNLNQPYAGGRPLPDTCDGMAWCECDDPDVELLGALMAMGLTQMQASRLLWGGEPRGIEQVRLWVRAKFLVAFPWLRLPDRWPDEQAEHESRAA